MNKVLIVALLFLFSCTPSKFVKAPTLYPVENYVSGLYNEPFFKEQHFLYAHDRQAKDSLKHYCTSETIIIENNKKRFFRNCEAALRNDNLFLKLDDVPFDNSFELKIVKSAGKLDAVYNQTFSIADSSYKMPVFKTISKRISLDKDMYTKGDILQAKFSLKILASYSWMNKYSDTIFVYGLIKTTVK